MIQSDNASMNTSFSSCFLKLSPRLLFSLLPRCYENETVYLYESLPACRVMGRFDPNHSWFM